MLKLRAHQLHGMYKIALLLAIDYLSLVVGKSSQWKEQLRTIWLPWQFMQ